MINLSQMALEEPSTLYERFRIVTRPDVYQAENVGDFLKERRSLKYPFYKDFPYLNNSRMPRAAVIFRNVGLTRVSSLLDKDEEIDDDRLNHFVIHDDTGRHMIYWGDENSFFNQPYTFEKAQEEQALQENDWVSEVSVLYLINRSLSFLIDVRKHDFSRPAPDGEKESRRLTDLVLSPSY